MAKSVKRRNKSRSSRVKKRGGQRRNDIPGVVRVAGPRRRLRVAFKVLDDVISTSLRVVAETHFVLADEDRMELAALNRAINILEASQSLLTNAHWEAASSQARQLFELLVNLEYIAGQPDPAQARFRYAKYGLIQFAERARRRLDYDQSTGRPIDETFADHLTSLLSSPDLDEFRDKNGKWRSSWSGKHTKALAELSPEPMRLKQYEMLFSDWSEETHAAPGALIGAILGSRGDDWIAEAVDDDDREIGQLILILAILFLELCNVLVHVPTPTLEKQAEWMEALDEDLRSRGVRPADLSDL